MHCRYTATLLGGALFAGLLAAVATTETSAIGFEEIATRVGLRFVTENCPTPNKNQPETMVAGVALFDYDQDGYLDVYFVNGAAIPSLKKEGPKYHNRLFHNNRDGTFSDVTERAGLAGVGYDMGVAVGDYDNDGRPDLYLSNVTSNQLFHNNRDGTFTDVTAKAGVAGGVFDGRKMWSVAAGWFDYDNDGLLDLFVSNYCKWEVNRDPYCYTAGRSRAYCNPRFYEPLPNTLYRNNGDGTFTDVSAQTGVSRYLGKGMGVAFADFDGDGFLDVFVANDSSPNLLFHNLGGRTFEEVGMRAGVGFAESGTALSGMGADFRDVDNDGLPDIWHTAVELETFPLYMNRGRGLFAEMTSMSGLARRTRQMSGWGNGIVDLDNDGWKDLFVARSNVLDNVSESTGGRQHPEPNGVFRNLGVAADGTANRGVRFADAGTSAGSDFQIPGVHRGVAFGDLDNDGRIDAVVSVLGGPAKLFHNVSPRAHHWILLNLVGVKSNRMAIGAQIRITTADGLSQYNEVTTSTGYACSSDSRVHFGLGAARRIREVEIRWPSGIKQVLRDVAEDRIVTIQESAQ